MEDKQIIKLFFARADEAIHALRVRFGNTLYKIAMNILGIIMMQKKQQMIHILPFGMQYHLKNLTLWLLMYIEQEETWH